MKATTKLLLVLGLCTLSGAGIVACGGGGGNNGDIDARPDEADASLYDAAPDADCVENPVTNAQLMNACTDSQRIEKHPTTGCWNADGVLPGLP